MASRKLVASITIALLVAIVAIAVPLSTAQTSYELWMDVHGGGITDPPAGITTYYAGSSVTITATSTTTAQFQYFHIFNDKGSLGNFVGQFTTNTVTLNMDANYHVHIFFSDFDPSQLDQTPTPTPAPTIITPPDWTPPPSPTPPPSNGWMDSPWALLALGVLVVALCMMAKGGMKGGKKQK